MNITDTSINLDTSYSDNSHIFGIPLLINEGVDGYMTIPVLDEAGRRSLELLGEWIDKTLFLERAGIDLHMQYGGII